MSARREENSQATHEPGVYVKTRHGAPLGFFACEAAGLDWLREGQEHGGARVVDVLGASGHALRLRRVESVAPDAQAAYEFGKALAITHEMGAGGWGAGPDGWDGPGYFGPPGRAAADGSDPAGQFW